LGKVYIFFNSIIITMFSKKLIFSLIFFVLICIPSASGATIYGTVYEYNLNIVKNAIVEVDSTPKQIYVAKDGTYTFTLPVGEYLIKADYESNYKKYSFEQNIIIQDEGDYVFDLILFPDISDETDIFDEEADIPQIYEEAFSIYWWQVIIVVVIILLVIFVIIFSRRNKKKKIEIEGDLTNDVLSFIKKNGGRVTQKDIRKQFPVSEAKVSLVITELEDKGLLKKIKRGRGNIIILNKK